MNKLLLSLVALTLVGAGCQKGPALQEQATSTAKTTTTTSNAAVGSEYTLDQVQAANSATKCWSVVNGNVYDLTPAINQHPGGKEAILFMCGKDASEAFNGKHGGQRRPESELAKLKIGVLKK